jgi:hypothetical protein
MLAALPLAIAAQEPATQSPDAPASDAPKADATTTADAAQPSSAVETATPPAAASEPAGVGPDVFLLPDAAGRLRRVLGYKYEDFFKAWQAQGFGNGDATRPTYSLTSLHGKLEASSEAANVELRLEVSLQSADWVETPLELGSLIVAKAQVEGGEGRDFVLFDPQRERYAAWFKGRPGDKRTVVVSGQLVVQRDGEGRQLSLALPASSSSTIDVTAPGPIDVERPADARVTMVGGTDESPLTRIEGARGVLELHWGPRRAGSTPNDAPLEATVDAIVRVEPGRLSYETFITLNSFGGRTEQVRVKLPSGAKLSTRASSEEYDLVPVAGDAPADKRQTIEVR